MGRQANWDAPSGGGSGLIFDEDYYRFAIETLIESPSSTGKLMYKATLRMVEPARWQGLPHFENFVIGTDEDPEATDAKTWGETVGYKQLKQMLEKVGCPLDRDMDLVCANAKDREGIVHFRPKQETKPGPYQGTMRNTVVRFYALGERPIGGLAKAAQPGNGPAPRQAVNATLAKQAALAGDDE